jgi:hypothetical protein
MLVEKKDSSGASVCDQAAVDSLLCWFFGDELDDLQSKGRN